MAAVSGESDIASAVVGARSGDESAVAVLFQHFQPRLLRYLNARIPGSADDIASETWLAVAERIGNFEGSAGEFAAWIFAIARNRVADNYRRQSRRPRTAPLASEEEEAGGRHSGAFAAQYDLAQSVVDEISAQEAVDRLVSDLPVEQAEVVLLRVLAGLSCEQVARVMGIRPGTVRVLQHRALRKLSSKWVEGSLRR